MASITKQVLIDAPPDEVWDAVRDFGAVHERLAPGFVVETRLEDGARVVTFFNGAVAREVLVGVDDDARRLVYSVVDSPLQSTHDNSSAQVLGGADGGSRFVWIKDVLPDELAPRIDELMEQGIGVVKQTLESRSPAGRGA
jgi:polyketide cyclase/dehydrase/lipid transport protein